MSAQHYKCIVSDITLNDIGLLLRLLPINCEYLYRPVHADRTMLP